MRRGGGGRGGVGSGFSVLGLRALGFWVMAGRGAYRSCRFCMRVFLVCFIYMGLLISVI